MEVLEQYYVNEQLTPCRQPADRAAAVWAKTIGNETQVLVTEDQSSNIHKNGGIKETINWDIE
jgi:hypothetical protein